MIDKKTLADKTVDNQAHPKDAFDPLREGFASRFIEMGLPQKKGGTYQYISLLNILSTPTAPTQVSKEQDSIEKGRYTFLDGKLLPLKEQSPKNSPLIALPFQEALLKYSSFLEARLKQILLKEQDPLVHRTLSTLKDALFLYIPKNEHLKEPIHLKWIYSNQENEIDCSTALFVYMGEGSSATFLFESDEKALSKKHVLSLFSDFTLERGASAVAEEVCTQGTKQGVRFYFQRASQKKQSLFQSTLSTNQPGITRHDYKILLEGKESFASLKGAAYCKENSEAHVNVFMEHAAENARSIQHFKNVLCDVSKTSFEGKIYVQKEAMKTDAYQLNNNLVLSDKALAYTKPNLEIFADDVKASHGATIGQLSNEDLFYMHARGLDKESAQKLLVSHYLKEIEDEIHSPPLRKLLKKE